MGPFFTSDYSEQMGTYSCRSSGGFANNLLVVGAGRRRKVGTATSVFVDYVRDHD